MEAHIIKALQQNPRVFKEFVDYLKVKKLEPAKVLEANTASQHMALFFEFFTRIYSLKITCYSDEFIATKGSYNVVTISIKGDYDSIIMVLVVALINYAENPF